MNKFNSHVFASLAGGLAVFAAYQPDSNGGTICGAALGAFTFAVLAVITVISGRGF